MYVAVKGGETAIKNAHKLFAENRRGDKTVPALTLAQIAQQMSFAVDRVMSEGSLYDRELAALAIKQSRGDLIEAIFLMRAYRTTLPRFGSSRPIETKDMLVQRRISATYKDLPGGQLLGPTFDYSHRLLDFKLAADGEQLVPPAEKIEASDDEILRVSDILGTDGLLEGDAEYDENAPVPDITREPMNFPVGRSERLQVLARGDEGFILGLGYSTQRGYGRNHAFAGEIRFGQVEVSFFAEELGFEISLGDIEVSECQMVNQFKGSAKAPPQFTRGYGLAFGQCERKVMAMSLVDRALRVEELGEEIQGPAQDAEFVLEHCDNIQATGFVEHLKLPHYVDFQAELDLVRTLRKEFFEKQENGEAPFQSLDAAE